jgi:pyrroloquinoline quinone biosynthesis protein B
MRVVVLGTAAGGGFPQWNCACRLCSACRAGDVPARTQDCLAVQADDGWYLVNASPDIRAQVLAASVLAPGPAPRDTPLRGALLTDAELDHAMGLLMLREGGGLRVFAPPAVLSALSSARDTVTRYGSWTWSSTVDIPGLSVTTFAMSNKKPRYAADSTVPGPWVVAYRLADPVTGGALVYAPCMRVWPDGFDEFVDGADRVLLDGTFFSSAEMPGAETTSTTPQHAMGHVQIGGADGSLARIAKHPGIRWYYTHLNNTNPVLDRRSPEYATVRDAGVEVPLDGTVLDV